MIAAIPAFVVAAAAVATHEKKSGLPQLNPADFSPQLIWLALTFVVLYLILARVALPRIGEVLDERRDRVQRDLDAAERFKADTDAALAAYEKALSNATEGLVDGQRYARQAHRRVEQGARAGGKRARREAHRSRGRIANTKAKALQSVNDIAAETASAVSANCSARR